MLATRNFSSNLSSFFYIFSWKQMSSFCLFQAGASSTRRATVPTSKNPPTAARQSKRTTSKVNIFLILLSLLPGRPSFSNFFLLYLYEYLSRLDRTFYVLMKQTKHVLCERVFCVVLCETNHQIVFLFFFKFKLFDGWLTNSFARSLSLVHLFCPPCRLYSDTMLPTVKRRPKEWWTAVRPS